ncbi:MAG: hypothetical protein ACI855_002135 [Myxococcota bacterium]|jgi:hypothetical protein
MRVAFISVLLGMPALAVASTTDLVQQVRLMDSAGTPINGDHVVTLDFMADETPGAPDTSCHEANLGSIAFVDGYASLEIAGVPSSCFTTDRWIAITVGVQDILPRQAVHDVPRAAVAGHVPTAASPSGCTSEGAVIYDTVADNLLVCDGTAWAAATGSGGAFPTDNSGGSSCSVAGDVRWTGNEFQGCDGSSWLVLAQAGTVTTPGQAIFVGTGGSQQFAVPDDVTSVDVKLWGGGGGGGGAGGWTSGYRGGGGGFVTGTVAVTPGEVLTVMVGTGGDYNFPHGSSPNYGGGGGIRYNANDIQYAASGGGRSALRRATSELLTAGGGGGGGSRNSSGPSGSQAGGGGGGLSGEAGNQTAFGASQGGTQSAGGTGGGGQNATGISGSRFAGGTSPLNSYGGGGGGGWYGGGGGGYDEPGTMGGGAGGSSYISGSGVSAQSTTGASGASAANAADPDYQSGAAVGGLVAGRGGDGLAVIRYDSGLTPTPLQNEQTFAFTGGDQTWVVPVGVNELLVKMWGGGGGGGAPGGWTQGFRGGAGGYTTAYITVTPGETLTMMVGQGGAYQFPNGGSKNYGGGGGWGASADNRYGASGGGRSSVRRGSNDVVIAGGGGGGGSKNTGGGAGRNAGGAGGGASGEAGYQTANARATGGSQSGPGLGGVGGNVSGQPGSGRNGGNVGINSYGGGGGGGYFGGGGGAYQEPGNMGGGGGGSSFVPPSARWGTSVTGWAYIPPATGDSDYLAGSAIGGPIAGVGGNGFIVIEY